MDIREEIKPKSFTWEKESFHRENSQTDLQIVMNLCSQHNNIIKMKRKLEIQEDTDKNAALRKHHCIIVIFQI